jgi:thiol:disulfide interchange protein DsbD
MKNILKLAVISFIIILSNKSFPQLGNSEPIVNINSYLSADKVTPGDAFKLAVKADIKNGWHINSDKPNEDFLIPTKLSIINPGKGFFNLENIVYPQAQDVKLGFSDKALSVWEGEVFIGGILKAPTDIQPGNYLLIVKLSYQSCNNSTCLAPTSVSDTLQVVVTNDKASVSVINQDIFKNVKLEINNTTSSVSTGNDNSITSSLESHGLLIGLLLVFLGGLALNLTPCVYPLIPITVGYFGGQAEGSTKRLFLMGLLFVIGMALTYSVIGVVTALSGAVFGSLLQNSYVILFIVLIFLVLSLSMFGVYEFKLPDSLVAKAGGAKGGMFGAFFMGLTMGIVAAPCIGPFVLGLVTYVAAKGDPYFGFLMFFVLALGLGLPYLFLAIFSGKIKSLPRAGEWMEGVKHVFGFILVGMALYFLLPLLPKSFSGYVLPVFMLITAAFLLFIEKMAKNIKGFKIFKIVFSILLIVVAVYSLIPSEKASINWKPYNENVLAANTANKKGTIIDFYADWCIPCKELDAKTFSDQTVINEAKNFTTLKADMTKSLSPEVDALRNKYNIVGVPTVLILNSKGQEVKRITGYVTPEEFHKILKEVD